jgi:glycosyltransferase involved in cell wall biosynthesis
VPGIVVFHDTRLQHFFAAYTEHDGPDRRYYLDLLERTYGSAVRVMGEEFIEQRGSLADLIEAAPMTLPALDNAVAAILHNAEEQTLLAQQTYIPTYYVPLSFRFDAAPDKPQNRDRNAPSRLIMFGFIGENRRLLPVLQALASMSDREDYRLDIYGVVEQQEAADAYVAESGLANLVSFHGFVPEPTLNMALEGADLALNLRWPSMGEASGSQLRIWASALPSLVTRTEWYAQLPAGTVFMIDQAEESVQIVRHLRALRTTPELFAAAGRRGRYVLESQHAPSRYAEALVEIAAAHSGQHLRRSGQALARRSAEVLLELTGAELARPLGWEIGRRIADLTGGK